ncbi:Hypothetical predicted protein [Octopus vulgaris]|uniref:Uncharacterized protein n=1 Tax=Octopus vulgaris TaxID=6645 RepID=A0AA36BG43_OCTVU|nr:Hypothetical predicted protein [Octopus vulgaris]
MATRALLWAPLGSLSAATRQQRALWRPELALGAIGLTVRGYEATASAMATRARSGRHWAHCPRLRGNSERYGDQSSLWAPLGSLSAATRQQRALWRPELALGAIGLTVRGYETTASAMATRARSGRHWAHCPRLRGNSERYGDQSSLWAPLGSLSAATRQQRALWRPELALGAIGLTVRGYEATASAMATRASLWAPLGSLSAATRQQRALWRPELALGAIGLTVRGYEATASAMATRARSGRHWAHCPRLRGNSERYGDQSSLWAPLGSTVRGSREQQRALWRPELALGAIGLTVRGYEATASAMATRARSGRHWAHCPRLRGNSERYGDQSSLWAPLGSLSAATRQQRALWRPELALGAIGLTVRGYETTASAMATRARSGRHWAHCPRLRGNSERYGDQSSLWAPLGSLSAATRQQRALWRPEPRSGRHWAQCPRLRDNSERYGDQSSLWAPLGSMSAATRQQ